MQVWQRLAPTGTWVRLAIVPALVFISMSIDRQYLRDFWHHLARGQAIVEQGRMIDNDIFTYTVAGIPFQDVNWLTQIYYYGTFELGGLALVQLLNSLMLAATFGLVVLFCWKKCGSLGIASAVGIFTFFGSWQVLTIRPQTISILLFLLIYWSLDQSRKHRWLLLVPPVLTGLWANLHGAFPAGIMLVGCYTAAALWSAWREGTLWTDRHWRWLALCLAATVAGTLVNPYGWTIYQYVGLTSNRASGRGIMEWLPPSTDLLIGRLFIVSVVIAIGVYLGMWFKHKRLPSAEEAVLILCFLPMACKSVRMIVWWMIIFAPMLAVQLASLLPKRKPRPEESQPTWGSAIAFALILLAVLFSVPGLERFSPVYALAGRSSYRLEHDIEKVHREIAQRADGGNIFARFEWGEYLSWTGAPNFKIFMDARIEIIPDAVWQEYIDLTSGKDNWQDILDRYKVDYLVLDVEYHRENGLLQRVEESPQWHRTFQIRDEIYLYSRTGGSTPLLVSQSKRPS